MIVKRILLIVLFAMTSSCARKAEVRAPEVVHTERYVYVQDDQGRWLIVTTAPKDLDAAMKQIHPGPASVNKVDLWIVTPLSPKKRGH